MDGTLARGMGIFAEQVALEQVAAVALAGTVVGAGAMVYQRHGRAGQATVAVYICSLVLVQSVMKLFFGAFPDLHFPSFITAVHSFTQFLGAEVMLRRRERPTCFATLLGEMGFSTYLLTMGPVAATVVTSIVCNNASLMYLGMAMNTLLGSLTPVATAILSTLAGKSYPPRAWLGVGVACSGGVLLTTVSAVEGSATRGADLGLILALLAIFLRAGKTVLQDRVMNSSGPPPQGTSAAPKRGPVELLALQSPLMTLVTLALSAGLEGLQPYAALSARLLGSLTGFCAALAAVAATSLCALLLACAGAATIKLLGAPAMQIAGKLNVLITATVAAAFLRESIDAAEAAGGALALLGAFVFESAVTARAEPSTKTDSKHCGDTV